VLRNSPTCSNCLELSNLASNRASQPASKKRTQIVSQHKPQTKRYSNACSITLRKNRPRYAREKIKGARSSHSFKTWKGARSALFQACKAACRFSDPTLLNPQSGYYTLSGYNIFPVFDGKCPI